MSRPVLPLRETRLTWWGYLCLLAVLSAAALGSLGDLRFDTHDQEYLLDSAEAGADISRFLSPEKRMPGRPGFELVLWAEYSAWGDAPRFFHLFGVLLHTGASALLAFTCRRLGMALEVSLSAGLLFLLNVAHFQAVHWIAAHCYLLVLVCACAGLISYLRFVEEGKRRFLVVFYLVLLFGVLTHVSALVALPFCVYLAWLRGHERGAVIRSTAPLGLLLVAATLGLKKVYPAAPQLTILAQELDLAGMLQNYLLCWSRLLTTAHWLPMALHAVRSWELVIGGLALVALGFAAIRRIFPLAEWTGWILLNLLPPLLLSAEYVRDIPAGPSRYLYLASAGSSAMLAWGARRLCLWIGERRHSFRAYSFVVILGLLTMSSIFFLKRAEAISLYTAGRNYLANGQIDEGVAQLKEAIAKGSELIDLEDVYLRLCPMLMNRGESVDPYLAAAQRRFPRNPTLHLYRQVVDSLGGKSPRQQQARSRLDSFRRRGNISRLIAEVYYHLGRGFFRNGDVHQAIAAFRRSLEFDSEKVKTHQSLAAALMAAGDRD